MRLYPLPADADDTTRLAYAGFAIAAYSAEFARNHLPIPEPIKREIIQMYGEGGSPAAEWIRSSLSP